VLTKSGLAAVIAAATCAAAGLWWHYEELIVIAVAAGVAVGGALWSSRVRHAARIQRTISAPRVARGDPIRTVYRAVNRSHHRSPSAWIVDSCDGATIRVALPAIGKDDRTEVPGSIPTRRRGVFEVGPTAIERVDALGLAAGRRLNDDAATVLVHPRLHNLTGPYGAMHTVEDEAVIRRSASDPLSGFVSLREYVVGDDPRLVHWPTSARMGTLMIREHVELRRPEFTVVLDAADNVADDDDFEEMVDIVASIAVHALRNGVDVRVRTTAREFPGAARPLIRDTQVLDLLTPVHQAGRGAVVSLAEIFHSGLDHTAIMLITGPTGPSSTFAHTDRLSVVRIGKGATVAPGVVLAVRDAQEFALRWRPWRN
jgi:uncharacterized protein (DUF58 family)